MTDFSEVLQTKSETYVVYVLEDNLFSSILQTDCPLYINSASAGTPKMANPQKGYSNLTTFKHQPLLNIMNRKYLELFGHGEASYSKHKKAREFYI